MIKSLLVAVIAFSASLATASEFSAFTHDNNLYVTILGDSCNAVSGSLDVAPICSKGRLTKNYATICSANLTAISTAIACDDDKLVPKVLVIDLAESDVAREAEELELTFRGQEIKVDINK